MLMRVFLVMAVCLLALPVAAQESGRQQREMNLSLSRYELAIAKLQRQNEQLQGDIRALQRSQTDLQRQLEDANKRAQGVADEIQKTRNTESLESKAAKRPWGERQRDCTELGVKHQQLKVTVSPDGKSGIRYLCFDGKALHLGSEVYTVDDAQ